MRQSFAGAGRCESRGREPDIDDTTLVLYPSESWQFRGPAADACREKPRGGGAASEGRGQDAESEARVVAFSRQATLGAHHDENTATQRFAGRKRYETCLRGRRGETRSRAEEYSGDGSGRVRRRRGRDGSRAPRANLGPSGRGPPRPRLQRRTGREPCSPRESSEMPRLAGRGRGCFRGRRRRRDGGAKAQRSSRKGGDDGRDVFCWVPAVWNLARAR